MSFIEDKMKGREGEILVIKFLRQKGYSVEDIGQDLGKWNKKENAGDYCCPDLRITGHVNGGEKPLIGKTVEVKTDFLSHITGNVCLEISSNEESGREGWIYSTRADYIAFLSINGGDLVIVPVERLKDGLEKTWQSYKKIHTQNKTLSGYMNSLALLVPIDEVKKLSLWNGVINVQDSKER